MKKAIAVLMAIAAIVFPQSAIAQYNTPHKWNDAFGVLRVYFPGVANTTVDILSPVSKTSTFPVSICGQLSLRQSSTRRIISFSVSSTGVNIPNFGHNNNSFSPPVCHWSEVYNTWVFNDNLVPVQSGVNAPNGYVSSINGTNQVFIKVMPAFTWVSSVQATVDYESTIKGRVNSCGFGVIRVTATRPMATFKIGAVNYTLAALPSVANPQICRTVGNSKIRYLPF